MTAYVVDYCTGNFVLHSTAHDGHIPGVSLLIQGGTMSGALFHKTSGGAWGRVFPDVQVGGFGGPVLTYRSLQEHRLVVVDGTEVNSTYSVYPIMWTAVEPQCGLPPGDYAAFVDVVRRDHHSQYFVDQKVVGFTIPVDPESPPTPLTDITSEMLLGVLSLRAPRLLMPTLRPVLHVRESSYPFEPDRPQE